MSSVEAEDIEAIAIGLRAVKCVDVAAFTYRTIDFLQTLEWELRYLWKGHRDWSLFKVVYVMARYQGFLDQALLFLFYHGTGLSPQACRIVFGVGCASALTGGIAAEVLTFLRIYVLSGCTKKMAWYLTVQFSISIVILAAFAGVYLNSVGFEPSPVPEHVGCYMARSQKSWLALVFMWTLIHQLIVLSLALYFGLASFRHSSNPLLTIFYRDGTLYLMVLVAAATVNIAVISAGPPVYQTLFMLFQATLHSTLSTRIILKMREMASRDLKLMQMNRTTVGAFSTNIEFGHHQHFTTRQ